MSDDLLSLFQSLDDQAEKKRSNYIRAPFSYLGSKSKSLPEILPWLPYRKKFIEVFGGSGVVILNRRPTYLDVYNDRYGGVVAFYRCIHDSEKYKKLIERLQFLVHSREEFYWCQETWDTCQDDIERAARWFYMIKTSVLSKGIAFARTTNSTFTNFVADVTTYFDPIHRRFKSILVENLDWSQCFDDFDSHDAVFYCDPPYHGTDQGAYAKDCKMSTLYQHEKFLERVAKVKGFVAVSHAPNKFYDEQTFWTDKFTWTVNARTNVLAKTETNHRMDSDEFTRHPMTECLYIKEAG